MNGVDKPSSTIDTVAVPILGLLFSLIVCTHRPTEAITTFHRQDIKVQKRPWSDCINIARDTENYCRECSKSQQVKFPMPQRAPLTNISIGCPWLIVVVDVLEIQFPPQGIDTSLWCRTTSRSGRCNPNAQPNSMTHHGGAGQDLLCPWTTRDSSFR